MESISLLELSLRLLVGVALGAAIGLERQWRLRTIGIRTNALVAAGSTLFVILGADGFGSGDPTRVASQVVSGIGFLGAGVIIRDGLNIRGLTTAATLWCAAAIGSLAGAGMFAIAALGTAFIVSTNLLLRPFSLYVNRLSIRRRDAQQLTRDVHAAEFTFEFVTTEKSEPRVRALVVQTIDRPEFTLRSVGTSQTDSSNVRVLAEVSTESVDEADSALQAVLQRMSLDPKVISSRWWSPDSED